MNYACIYIYIFPVPENQHPGSARLGFPTRIWIRGPSSKISIGCPTLPAPKLNILDPPASAFRHGSESVVTPQDMLLVSPAAFRHGSGSLFLLKHRLN